MAQSRAVSKRLAIALCAAGILSFLLMATGIVVIVALSDPFGWPVPGTVRDDVHAVLASIDDEPTIFWNADTNEARVVFGEMGAKSDDMLTTLTLSAAKLGLLPANKPGVFIRDRRQRHQLKRIALKENEARLELHIKY